MSYAVSSSVELLRLLKKPPAMAAAASTLKLNVAMPAGIPSV